VIGIFTAWLELERFREYLISISEEPTGDRYIFCNSQAKVIQVFREGFTAVIKEAGVEKYKFGKKFVPNSCRHTYITFWLKYGKNLSIHSLAKYARTNIMMIRKLWTLWMN
jgi:hypothetical protein